MASCFPIRKINSAVNPTQAQPRLRLASGPKEPLTLKFSLITGGNHEKSSPARNIFTAKNRIRDQEENVLFVDFASSNSKITPKAQTFPAPREQTPQHSNKKEGTSIQTNDLALESQEPSGKQSATKIIKLLTDMCNSIKSQSSVQKGLKNKCDGRFDQNWVIKWFIWFSYVVAMQLKRLAVKLISTTENLLSNNVRAESAKTPHAG